MSRNNDGQVLEGELFPRDLALNLSGGGTSPKKFHASQVTGGGSSPKNTLFPTGLEGGRTPRG